MSVPTVARLRAVLREIPGVDWTKQDDLTRYATAVHDALAATSPGEEGDPNTEEARLLLESFDGFLAEGRRRGLDMSAETLVRARVAIAVRGIEEEQDRLTRQSLTERVADAMAGLVRREPDVWNEPREFFIEQARQALGQEDDQ